MDKEKHFITRQRIVELFNRKSKERVEKDVIKGLQLFSEKFISDLLNRTILFCKHKGSNQITSDDVLFTVEKEFDFSFGQRVIQQHTNLPTDAHINNLADISKSK